MCEPPGPSKKAKQKADGWVQVFRMHLPGGALKAWGMKDRYSAPHVHPLGEEHQRSIVVFVKESVLVVLEAC